jgi:hypothetical protein
VLSILAFRLAPASRLAPLVYVELVGAALMGYLMFNEVPGLATIIGAGLIIAGGLVLLDEKPSARRADSSNSTTVLRPAIRVEHASRRDSRFCVRES